MKKKILSIALVLGILQMLLCSIPVSAAGEAYTRSLPYAFFDYEDGVNNVQDAQIVDGGIAGSGKCLKYIADASDDTAHDDSKLFLGNGQSSLSGKVPANHTFKASFYLKITQELTKGNLMFIFTYKEEGATSSMTIYPMARFDKTKLNEWQKVEFDAFTPTKNAEIVGITMRFGNNGAHTQNCNFVVGDETKAVPREYYIDDMEFSVTSPHQGSTGGSGDSGGTTPSAPAKMTLADYTMDFQNGSSIHNVGGQNATTTPSTTNGQTIQLVQDPAGGSNIVLKVDLPSSDVGDNVGLGFSESTTSTTRAPATVPVGGKITYTFRYYIPEEVKSSPSNLRTHPSFVISHYPGSVFAKITEPAATTAQQWHTATLEYTNTGSSAKELGGYQLRFNGAYENGGTPAGTTWILASHTGSGYGDRTFYFDDFRVTVTDPNLPPPAETSDLSLNDYSMDFESDSSIQINGSNITDTEAGTASELACVSEDPADSNNKAMKLTLAPTAIGTASTMKFSGATGAGTDKVTAPGTIPAGGKITYKFKYYLANEVDATVAPAFKVKHTTGGAIATQATAFETTAGQWHEAKLTYTNNATTDLAVDGATLLYSGDDANATQWKAADGSALVIYFDDFTVETKAPSFPISSGLRFNGNFAEGEEVTFYHSFTPSEEGATDDSIVRFMCTIDGMTGSLGSCKLGDTFTVPVVPQDATLTFEVFPVDSEGVLGVKEEYSYAEVVGQYAKLNLSFKADGSAKAEVTVENKRFDNSDINAVLIVVMLNDKNGIIDYEEKAIKCVHGATISGTDGALTVPTDNADPALSKVTKAAAFLWYCKDNTALSFTNTTLEELVQDKIVVKTHN